MKGNGHKLKYNKFHLNIRKQLFYCGGCHTLKQVAQGDPGVSILGDTQKPTGHGPEEPALVDHPLDRRVGLQTQVFCDFINAKCREREGCACVLAPRKRCPSGAQLLRTPARSSGKPTQLMQL